MPSGTVQNTNPTAAMPIHPYLQKPDLRPSG